MENDINKHKEEVRLKLESELYVESYETFKQSVEMLNLALESFGINHKYDYDGFCTAFTNECLEYIDTHPGINMLDPTQISFYTLPIILSIVEKAKNKYGLIQ